MQPKTHNIHLNNEWISAFVEGVIYQLEQDIGPFLSSLYDYDIQFKKQDTGLWKITINYAIISDSRNLDVYFEISEKSSIEALRLKIEISVEEIIARIKRFNERTFANEDNEG